MFKFSFEVDDAEDGGSSLSLNTAPAPAPESSVPSALQPWTDIPLQDLIDLLPPAISYSPLALPTSPPTTLPRRDLFDARFQLINDDAEDETFVSGESDLIPGTYEGGLKSWECAGDLVGVLQGLKRRKWRGRKVLELGCGTAVPSLWVFKRVLEEAEAAAEHGDAQETVLHLQDYNRQVLELVTLPNLLLTWYHYSRSASAFHPSGDRTSTTAPPPSSGELELSPALLSAFLSTLPDLRITLLFSSGAWSGASSTLPPADLILTSETVYSPASLPSLVHLLHAASHSNTDAGEEEEGTLVLVAAKVLYFGVGGGVREFVEAVQGQGGWTREVFSLDRGVGRKVLRVGWEAATGR